MRDEQRAALVAHGYNPDAAPSGVSHAGDTMTWPGVGGVLLRYHVCELDGMVIDGHEGSDLDPEYGCLHCAHGHDDGG